MRQIILTVEEKNGAVEMKLDAPADPAATPGENAVGNYLAGSIEILLKDPRHCFAAGSGKTREEAEMRVNIDDDIRKAGQ